MFSRNKQLQIQLQKGIYIWNEVLFVQKKKKEEPYGMKYHACDF